ncbi:MAG: MBL fold metallo-hydrolase [Acutalibacteraceae bacterium]
MKITKIELEPFSTNCYILIDDNTKKAAIIDPAICSQELLNHIKSSDISEIEYILLTHGHFDHILGVADLKGIYKNAKVAIHSLDADSLSNPKKSLAKSIVGDLQKPVNADIILNDNDKINLGDLSIEVLHTPGHTPGSVCFLCGDTMFSGDTLFCKTVGRTDFEGGSMDDMLKSVNRLGNLKGDYNVFPGHSEKTTLDEERKHNRYMRKNEWF